MGTGTAVGLGQVGSSFPPRQGQVHAVIMMVLRCVLLEPLREADILVSGFSLRLAFPTQPVHRRVCVRVCVCVCVACSVKRQMVLKAGTESLLLNRSLSGGSAGCPINLCFLALTPTAKGLSSE